MKHQEHLASSYGPWPLLDKWFWRARQPEQEAKALAQNLLRLARYHKEHCDGSCDISLGLLGIVIRDFLRQDLAEDELKMLQL